MASQTVARVALRICYYCSVYLLSELPPYTASAHMATLSHHTRTQSRVLSTLRSILRHIAESVDNRIGNPPVRDSRSFSRHVLDQYRAGAACSSRTEVKQLRARGDAYLGYLTAVSEQRSLIIRHRGGDPDTDRSRRSAAQYVGLSIPEQIPLGRDAASAAGRYAGQLAASRVDITKLTGIENLKAQLYGVPGSKPAFSSEEQQPPKHGEIAR